MFNIKFAILFVVICLTQLTSCQELDQLDALFDHLVSLGNDAKVGFLTASNYASVRRILPSNARPVYVTNKDDLTNMVLNGSLVAALTSGVPHKEYHDYLHIFSSSIVTMQSILMAPDNSTDNPHGVEPEFSTYELSMAINAAISRVQFKGTDLEIAKKNAPKEIILAHTCKEEDQSQFPVPNKNEAKGLLRKILDDKVIKVLADGPYNWGDNDGNYLVDPPVGFYPDLLDAIIDEFRNLSGPDQEVYGEDIRMERVSTKASPFPWYQLFDGTVHITEPYFILDAPYGGSGKNCTTDDDCLGSNLVTGKEICRNSTGTCIHPNRPRVIMFRASCTVLGTDSKFFTKRSIPFLATTPKAENKSSSNVAMGISIGILAVLVVGLAAGVTYMIIKEKRGTPIFIRFN